VQIPVATIVATFLPFPYLHAASRLSGSKERARERERELVVDLLDRFWHAWLNVRFYCHNKSILAAKAATATATTTTVGTPLQTTLYIFTTPQLDSKCCTMYLYLYCLLVQRAIATCFFLFSVATAARWWRRKLENCRRRCVGVNWRRPAC